jgi:hypothetical protein
VLPLLPPKRKHRSAQLQMEKKTAALHMACKGTYKWNFSNPKKCYNAGIPRILALFWICKIPLVSILTGHEKCHPFSHLGALTEIRIATIKKLRHFACHLRAFKLEFQRGNGGREGLRGNLALPRLD